jgi:hypothetical protein
MTALAGLERLESTGIWRPGPDQAPHEVMVTFGKATLVIRDFQGRALTHWSLAALRVVDQTADGTRFVAGVDDDETVDIADPAMLQAIAQVQAAIAARHVRPGRIRRRVMLGLGLGALGLALWLLPPLFTRQLIASLPEARRAELGAVLLGQMQRQSAVSCRAPQGTLAAGRLAERLWPGAGWQIVVLPQGLTAPQALPGHILLVPEQMLTAVRDPAILAADLMAATLGADPAERLFADAGLVGTFRIVTRGDLPPGDLGPQAAALLAASAPAPDVAALQMAMEQADVPFGPWARANGVPPADDPAQPPVLTDADWIALQAICAG